MGGGAVPAVTVGPVLVSGVGVVAMVARLMEAPPIIVVAALMTASTDYSVMFIMVLMVYPELF